MPRDPSFDSTLAFFRKGYDFVGERCGALGSDTFRTRLFLRPVTIMTGAEAAARFYDGASFSRTGAMPPTTLRLLQDKGSVQALDGAAHRHRKRLFLDLLAGKEPGRAIGEIFERRWRETLPDWTQCPRIVLHDALRELLFASAAEWAGVPVSATDIGRRTREIGAMIDGAGSLGPKAVRGLLLRQRSEHWARELIDRVRAGTLTAPEGSALTRVATFRDADGSPLDRVAAGVELLNLLRPTVAVARFLTFAALALHQHPHYRCWLNDDADRHQAFAQEVRRYYPFFPVIGGTVRTPFTWRGARFARGDWFLLGLHATNHDPVLWPQPQTFRPERFLEREPTAFDLVPQGAGEHDKDHRCPGEWFTLELIRRALKMLCTMTYLVPSQDLRIPQNCFPTLPLSGFVITDIQSAG